MTTETFNLSTKEFQAADGSTIFEKFKYSAAVKAGDFLYVAGQIGLNEDGTIPDADKEQSLIRGRDVKLLPIDLPALPLQQDLQSSIAEASPFRRQFPHRDP